MLMLLQSRTALIAFPISIILILFAKKHFNKNHYQLAKLITLFVEPITRILYLLSKFDLKGIFVLLSAYKKLIKKIT